jgi:hypothetical protein
VGPRPPAALGAGAQAMTALLTDRWPARDRAAAPLRGLWGKFLVWRR